MTDHAASLEYWLRMRGTSHPPVWREEDRHTVTESVETDGIVTEDLTPPDTTRHTFATLDYLWALTKYYLLQVR